MQYFNILLIGLMSLVSTITAKAAIVNGKPALAKRLYTTASGHCTAVCDDQTLQHCYYDCSPSRNVQAAISGGSLTSFVDGPCTAVCRDDSRSGLDCLVHCGPTATRTPVLQKRFVVTGTHVVTATYQGCTAICTSEPDFIHCDDPWCDPDFPAQTPAPTPKPLLERRTLTSTHLLDPLVDTTYSDGCKQRCRGDMDEIRCVAACPRTGAVTRSPETNFVGNCENQCYQDEEQDPCMMDCMRTRTATGSPEATEGTAAANLKDRAELEARQAHKARLARKFDLAARDHTVTVTVTSIPASCTAGPQESAIEQASVALSEASVAIAQAGSVTTAAPAFPPAASIALSEASAFLSSIAATPVVAPPVFANITIVPGPSAPSVAPATGRIATLPTSLSATPTSLATGAASESKNINGFFLVIIMGLMGNIALMV